jgi:hypothetical protein
MKNFVIVPASEGPRREFKITWGLRAGYGPPSSRSNTKRMGSRHRIGSVLLG